MDIHQFPGVQIHGNHAQIREGQSYIELGRYNEYGEFVWSEEGRARRKAFVEPVVAQVQPDAEPKEPKLEKELEEARGRNKNRLKAGK